MPVSQGCWSRYPVQGCGLPGSTPCRPVPSHASVLAADTVHGLMFGNHRLEHHWAH